MVQAAQGNDHLGRAYDHIRRRVVDGTFAPGTQIKASEAAAELRLSTTPVREALARLVGEGLVADHRRQGYFVPVPSSYDLVDLYSLSELILTAAAQGRADATRPVIRAPDAEPDVGSPSQADPKDAAALIFDAILLRTNNFALIEAGGRTLDRLAAARRAEAFVLNDGEIHISRIQEALATRESGRVVAALRSYHHIRREHAEQLSYALAGALLPGVKYIPKIS